MTLLWVGLGNPEPQMSMNRHNVGFMAVDAIATRHGFQPWRRHFMGLFSEGRLGAERIFALKPQTYMNASGDSVQRVAGFYKLSPEQITVFHDELDLTPGKIRIKKSGSTAGHNGLRSIDRALNSSNYWRVRLGIGHPGSKTMVHGHVLSNFTKEEWAWLGPMLHEIAEAAPLLARGDTEGFLRRVSVRSTSERAKDPR